MILKAKRFILATIASLLLTVPGIVPATGSIVFANDIVNNTCSGSNASGQVNASQGVSCSNSGSSINLANIAKQAVNIFSYVVGAIAIIMVIYGGFRYITSGGGQENVSSAKNTLLYAIIGLVIVALAQVIVHFVLNASSNTVSGGPTT